MTMQLSIFRIIFGLYLCYHFYELIPYSEELFGSKMPFNPKLSPTYGIFPNILNLEILSAQYFITTLLIISISFTIGYKIQICSFLLWYGFSCLFNRNILISNPGIPYVGWLLLACAIITHKSKEFEIINKIHYARIFWMAWFLMALGYTISGLHKLQCESWLNGTAMIHILNSPLGRNNFLCKFILNLPEIIIKLITWSGLSLEISFLPLGIYYHTRMIYWVSYIFFHITIMLLIDFVDLTLGVMMIHLFTFETRWITQSYYYKKIKENLLYIESKICELS